MLLGDCKNKTTKKHNIKRLIKQTRLKIKQKIKEKEKKSD